MILITGGTGFLGSYLAWDLINRGNVVSILKRAESSMLILERIFRNLSGDSFRKMYSKIRFIDGDLLDIYSLSQALEGVTKVYHCAAIVSFESRKKNQMMETNINGTENLVNALLKNPGIRLCHVSSIAAIGRGGADDIITEETSWKTSRFNSHYAISKYGGEREVWRGIEEGLDAVIVNPAIILGYGEINSGTSRFFNSVKKGLKIYPGGVNGFVDVFDVVKAMVLLMDSGVSGERYILSAGNISYKDLFSNIADTIGKKGPVIRANSLAMGIAWRFESLRSVLTGSKPLITHETATTSMQNYVYSGEKILTLNDFNYTPFLDTINRLGGNYNEEWGS